MKQFIIKFLIFLILLFSLSICFDKIITLGLRKSETKLFTSLTKSYQGTINADLIINGSSKALVQINPFILDSVLKINSYNLGLDGTPFIPQKALYDLYRLKNKKPKIIIQVVSNGTLRDIKKGFLNSIKFAPYINIKEVKKTMKFTNSFSYLDYNLPIMRYSGKPFEIITGLFALFDIQLFKFKNNKGYAPNNKYWKDSGNNKSLIDQNNSNSLKNIKEFISLNNTSVKIFERFLTQCEKENILVFLVYPPIYYKSFNTIRNIDYYKNIAQKYNAVFLDYSKHSTLTVNKNYFYNSQHLNTQGANLFTKFLANDIKVRTHNNVYKSLGER